MNIGSRKKLHFHPNIYITLYFNVSSTLLRKNRNTDFLGRHGNIVLDIKTRISLEAEFQSFHFQVIAPNLGMFTL